jgi:Disulphide bond corrector protein DsbC
MRCGARSKRAPQLFRMKPLLILPFLLPAIALCQSETQKNVLKVAPPDTVTAKTGSTVRVALSLQVDEGYHVNSNTPAEDYLIPLKLTWTPGPLQSGSVSFPKPLLEKFTFSEKPVSVFKGAFEIATRFKVPADAKPGPGAIAGKLHYQACNDRMCLTPKTVDVAVPIEIVK